MIKLQVAYKNKTIQEVCTKASVAEMIQFRIGQCHPLKNNRKNQYAVDLVHPNRLVFEKVKEEIQVVKIIEIVDYH